MKTTSCMMMIITLFSMFTIPTAAWIPSSVSISARRQGTLKSTSTLILHVSRSPNERGGGSIDNNDDDEEDDDENLALLSNADGPEDTDYMSVVRKLQDSYYKTAAPRPPCRFAFLDEDRAVNKNNSNKSDAADIVNLPILTWPWHEVPGRSNVLHVHEGTYTHMLETILRSNPPVWYFGHVYRHGKERQLQTWSEISLLQDLHDEHDEEAGTEDYNDMELKRSNNVVMGTLCRITDYRRMNDGRLLVLTQAVERFVVEEVTQRVPFSVANVQLLPDIEEEEAAATRHSALLESFQKWHRYEFENTMLPLPFSSKEQSDGRSTTEADQNENDDDPGSSREEYLEASQIVGSALAQVLPYSPFSSVVNVERLSNENLRPAVPREEQKQQQLDDGLEQHLLKRGILRGPPFVEPTLLSKSCDELEHELWIYMDKYLKQSKRAVSWDSYHLINNGPRILHWSALSMPFKNNTHWTINAFE